MLQNFTQKFAHFLKNNAEEYYW